MRPRPLLNGGVAIFLIAAACLAQEPARISYDCAEEDLQWAGMSCTEDEPCPIYLEITSIIPIGRKVFVGGNLHGSSATLASILLSSDDAGVTWKEPAARIRGVAIDQVQFYDADHGWAAGEIQYPLARDPFFLVTTDGGASWRHRPVGEDGIAGAVQRFWFDSTDHGQLIIDAGKASEGGRYHLYESETGGESWTLRSATDRAPRIARAPATPDNPDWRVRAGKDEKLFQLEQRVDNHWNPISVFPVQVASCKLESGQLKEPELPAPPAPVQPAPPASKQRKKK